jgi:prepilin-type N-terminal cleavage/methylation domain-containing protein
MSRSRTLSSSGFTLVELAVATALFLLLMSSAIVAARGGMDAFKSSQDLSDLETRARRALDRAVFELVSCGASELDPNPTGQFGTESLEFRQVVGLAGTTPVFGVPMSLAFEYGSEETDDGIDNDGNGLVDDGLLVLTRDVGGAEQRIVLCRGVREYLEGEVGNGDDDNGNGLTDEAGFNVQRVGDVLFVRLSLEEAVPTGSVVRTLQTAVRLRN